MPGKPQYATLNAPLTAALNAHRPLVAVHRGTGLGTIAENTARAVQAALRQGADIVELDVIRSTDGDFFLFHDGYESMHFGTSENIRSLATAEIEALEYSWCATLKATSHVNQPAPGSVEAGPQYGVERLATVLEGFPDALLNLDRAWWFFDTLLPYLDQFGNPGRLLLKSPPDAEWLDQLAAHPVKYPYLVMARTQADIDLARSYPNVNLVGIELIAADAAHEFADPAFIAALQADGLFVFLNAINLNNRVPLFCGYDDEISVLENPDAGWGRLVDLGADVIQTDWPGLLVPYRETRDARVPGTHVVRV